MKCPKCNQSKLRCIDSRPATKGNSTWRRLECSHCFCRFSSHEFLAHEEEYVIRIRKEGKKPPFMILDSSRMTKEGCTNPDAMIINGERYNRICETDEEDQE